MASLSFAWPWMIFFLPFPWVLARIRKSDNWRPSAIFYPGADYKNTAGDASKISLKTPVIMCLLIAWVSFIIALSRPQVIGEAQTIPHTGRDIMLAVDLSESMEIADMQLDDQMQDRLTMLKSLLVPFIKQRKGDRIGLILFADTAYLQAPLTFDLVTLSKYLQQSQTGLIGDATAITDAIGLAAKEFEASPDRNKVLVILSDGDNTSGNLTRGQALDIIEFHDINVYAVKIGAEKQTDASFLQALATQSDGHLFTAANPQSLTQIINDIEELEPTDADLQTVTPIKDIYYFGVVVAIGMFLSAVYLARRRQWNG